MNLELLPHQYDFLSLEEKYGLLVGGIGSGKSFAGAVFILNEVATCPKALHFIGANTYTQLRDSTLNAMFSLLDSLDIKYSYNQNRGLLEFAGGKVLCRSMENFNMLRGIEIGSYWLDESRDLRKEAFMVLNGRQRNKYAKKHLGRLTTSPNGFDWQYDYFAGELKTNDFAYIKAKSVDNVHLPEGYLASLEGSYDSKLRAQELEGEFINITSGQTYYSFTREGNVEAFNPKGLPIWIGMDFNVNPMTAIMTEVWGDTVMVFDEVYLMNSNTYKMRDEIKERYGVSNISIVPDGTGKALKTSAAGVSDHHLLREYFGARSVVASANPFVKDRKNCVNGLLEKKRIIVHPRCKMLIKDFEQVNEVKNDETLTHISDALGYLCWNLFPIRSDRKFKVSYY